MGDTQHDQLKLAILAKSLFAKLLVLDQVKLYSPKEPGFLKSILINKYQLRTKYSYSFNKTYSKNKVY